MKKLRISSIITLLTISALALNAQKIKIESGSLTALKGEKEVNVVFVYDGMSVGKFKSEKDYIEKKKKEADEKEAGKGAAFESKWKEAREFQYEPKFIELFNKNGADMGMKVSQGNKSLKYTFEVKTTFTEPGWNIGISRVPAFINVTITVLETATQKAVGKVTMLKVPGQDAMGFDYDSSYRIAEAYAKCGKSLAKFIEKKTK
ncbi:MAG: hypothetical protein KBG80_11210 [Breznakibacter sp.]|nr:hypothetical protein [Breznakibacter sp.]